MMNRRTSDNVAAHHEKHVAKLQQDMGGGATSLIRVPNNHKDESNKNQGKTEEIRRNENSERELRKVK